MRAVLAAVGAALVLTGAASAANGSPQNLPPAFQVHPGMPFHSSGSVVGEGQPLKAYASIQPTVHLFGDTLSARLAVVADTRWVDPKLLRVHAGFAPYTVASGPTLLDLHVGRFEQLTWTWKLRCITATCVPIFPPSETLHVFHFPSAHVVYMRPNGKRDFSIGATWPGVEVLSQISPGVESALLNARKYDWHWHGVWTAGVCSEDGSLSVWVTRAPARAPRRTARARRQRGWSVRRCRSRSRSRLPSPRGRR